MTLLLVVPENTEKERRATSGGNKTINFPLLRSAWLSIFAKRLALKLRQKYEISWEEVSINYLSLVIVN
jgi:hypothetical protein